MKKFYTTLGALSILFMFSCQQDEGLLNDESDAIDTAELTYTHPIEGQYIVVLKKDKSRNLQDVSHEVLQDLVEQQIDDLLIKQGIKAEISRKYSSTIRGFVAKLTDEQRSKLESSDDVAYIEQDMKITMGRGGKPGGGSPPPQETPPGIDRVNGVEAYNGSGVAWILDTGIDLDHDDLNVDESRGFNAFTRGRDGKNLDDGNGHGTHVAGTVAAINNEIGVIGVAPGATVIPVKVLGANGSGSYSGIIAGVEHVMINGSPGDVANMSLRGGRSDAVNEAVIEASDVVKFVVASGNDSDDANNYSPASANGPNIYTIAAVNHSDAWASFSNYGDPPVDYCAPGVGIRSTWKDNGYNTISGTSMASPHAAGVLLLGSPSSDGTAADGQGASYPIIVH